MTSPHPFTVAAAGIFAGDVACVPDAVTTSVQLGGRAAGRADDAFVVSLSRSF